MKAYRIPIGQGKWRASQLHEAGLGGLEQHWDRGSGYLIVMVPEEMEPNVDRAFTAKPTRNKYGRQVRKTIDGMISAAIPWLVRAGVILAVVGIFVLVGKAGLMYKAKQAAQSAVIERTVPEAAQPAVKRFAGITEPQDGSGGLLGQLAPEPTPEPERKGLFSRFRKNPKPEPTPKPRKTLKERIFGNAAARD